MDKRGYVWYHTVKLRPTRPHKMIFRKALILMKLLHWILIAILSAAAAFCRLRLLAFGFDESGMPVPADLNTLALPVLGRRLKGYDDPDALLTGVETRSSSPVKLVRDEHYEANIRGVYPCGEGAGYAGGILSAAADGMRCAEKIWEVYGK